MHEICHVEIPTTDFAKSKEFYETLFGWKVEVDPVTNYAMWTKAKTAVGDIGWYALFEDPAGGVVGLWESAKKG
jgi:predicted enzyme related to lactoylglutathione lyase